MQKAYATTRNFLERVNCSSVEDPHAEMACLRQLDWAAVMVISNDLTYGRFLEYMSCSGPHWFTFFHYVMDGQTFPMQPRDAIAAGKFIRGGCARGLLCMYICMYKGMHECMYVQGYV